MINDALQELVNCQANNEGFWFEATTAPEAHLQQALRDLHRAIEDRQPAFSSALSVNEAQTGGSIRG